MAKRRGPNVSAAIKEYLDKNPGTGPTEAAKAVSAVVGKKVSPTYVSNIKSTLGTAKKKPGRKPGRKAGVVMSHAGNGSVDLVTLSAMKDILGKVGAETARKMIDVLC